MHYYEVAPTKIIRTASTSFTYSSEAPLLPGHIVQIPIGKTSHVGVVLKATPKPSFETRPITALIEPTPLPSPLIKTALWMSDYYATHLALVLQTLLPRGITKTRRALKEKHSPVPHRDRTTIVFNAGQTEAIKKITTAPSGTLLLHGVTGSGKTAVYIEAARHVINKGKSVIVLVPEIALTTQLLADFSHHFSSVTVTHSEQTEAERHTLWRTILADSSPQVIIGPRSALFMPVSNVGLVVVDESHEPSFKQEQTPRYSALRVASVLASYHNAPTVLGSATPSITDYYLAGLQSPHAIISMPKRARQKAAPPSIHLVDMRKRRNPSEHPFLSSLFLEKLSSAVASGHQALIFHNRRGSTTISLCEQCGWTALCQQCVLPLTLHADLHTLICHTCGSHAPVPTSCPQCGATDVIHKGIGTKRIETELKKLFPNNTVARFDADDTGNSVHAQYNNLYSGAIDIIIGTQIIAKGLDLPKLRFVGVVQADASLSLPDYSSSERVFQLLAQVVGRVGRNPNASEVVVQAYNPDHYALLCGVHQNYEQFYYSELRQRKKGLFPPYTYLLKLTCSYKTEAAAIRNSNQLLTTLRKALPPSTTVLGPAPAFYERLHGAYRWQLIVKSPSRAVLVEALDHIPQVHWQFELDPTTLL